ncbi:hypothetical protein [Thermomonospora umbrina]|uniref:Uncharacterized protein n=1 Tax=Thermomonospora umbrina TaxID=111806 RepID=A0A3D9T161_9ACTN|nr:hypothetical protein [Thermomonospora umbrina]REE97561.1 hypothetical protein DFJ69_3034 [Thermomonospora umbrina]
MNRSLSKLIRTSMLAPLAAVVVLPAAVPAPAQATTAPVRHLAEGAVQSTVPMVVSLLAPVPYDARAGRPRPKGGPRPLTDLGGNAVAQAQHQLGLTGLVPECAFVAEGAVDGIQGPLRKAAPRRKTKAKSKVRSVRKCGNVRHTTSRRLSGLTDPAGLVGGLTGGVQPGSGALGSLGSPHVGAGGLRTSVNPHRPAPDPAYSTTTVPVDPVMTLNTILPAASPSGLSGLFGGLPGAAQPLSPGGPAAGNPLGSLTGPLTGPLGGLVG